jgi:3-oxoacyl-[acyl-carrier protein] reductase
MNTASLPLHNTVALVTGASRGIGAAIAARLARDGADVLIHYGSGAEEAAALAQSLQSQGHRASTVQADLADPQGPFTLMREVASRLQGRLLNVLVNNAGVAPFAATADTAPDTFDRLAQVNMRSVFFVTQQALPLLATGASIVNLSSLVTRTTFPGIPAYSATKGFVDTLTLHWAQEFAPRGVRVNAVAPGAIDTRMSAWIHGPGGKETLAQIQALPGVGQPDDVAGVVSFLAGPSSRWITGQVIDASGGTKL